MRITAFVAAIPIGAGRDFITTRTGVLPAAGDKWLATPPRKLWERALGDGYSPVAAEDGRQASLPAG
jgi:hypothetical protein